MGFSVNGIVGTHKKVWRNVQEKVFSSIAGNKKEPVPGENPGTG